MPHQFRKHYSRDEARALLPQIRTWLRQLNQKRELVEKCDKRLGQLLQAGHDAGGELVNNLVRYLAAMREVLQQFQEREIQIKDLERGLIDFPALIGGREVFLCWEQDEDDIEFWHDLDTGYAGRERL
ncbi:MAG: DUF2203 domain-containing protein [Verrucomicrobia bacterium]|nr:DUF2203 domain-containing protein [Verrucomicrobiota bacterium]